MKLHILGTCGGSEPMPDRHHVSFIVEFNNRLYWFDAGENCSYTAHLMGLDLMRTRKICITHTHMDHIGGLGNLFWTIRKLDSMHHDFQNRNLELFIPEIRVWDHLLEMLAFTEGGFSRQFNIHAREFDDGVLFEDDGMTVSARHNRHLPHEEGAPWRSFGFSIEAEGKKIVYSGDTGGLEDVFPMLTDCNVLLMETGHHLPVEIASQLLKMNHKPDLLAFIHHGRAILNDRDTQNKELKEILGDGVCILEDATTLVV